MKSRGPRLRLGSPALRSCSSLKLEGDLNPSSQRGNPEMARHTVGLALSQDGGAAFVLSSGRYRNPPLDGLGKDHSSESRIPNCSLSLPFSAQHSRALASDTLRSHLSHLLGMSRPQ